MTEDAALTMEALIARAEAITFRLYDGVEVPHRSCGIALAETFGRATEPYQALRRGGITGEGECGAIQAGLLILGEIFGDPDPTASVTDDLRAAAQRYRELWQVEVERGSAQSIVCNDLTGQFAAFRSQERHAFCTRIAASVSRCVARVVLEHGAPLDINPE